MVTVYLSLISIKTLIEKILVDRTDRCRKSW